jgi:dTDP-4-amino-4,6-dideoxygalactose transaminase
MRVLPTSPTWLTPEDFLALFVPDGRATVELQETLEHELARYFGRHHAVLTSSGTAGIYLALKALHLPETAEVITPAFTCFRVPNAIVASGLLPRFADVDDTANMSAELVEARLNRRTRVLLLTHLYGNPAHVESLLALAAARGLAVIEDACMTFDAEYNRQRCGSFGHAAVFSLNRAKVVSAFGGGVVVTDDPNLAMEMRALRALESRPLHPRQRLQLWRDVLINNLIFHPWLFGNVGKRLARTSLTRRFNRPATDTVQMKLVRLTQLADFQLRLALSQLRRAKWFAERRARIAANYVRHLADFGLTTIKTEPHSQPGWSHYSLVLNAAHSRAKVSQSLVTHGVQPGELFNYVCPLTPAYRTLGQTGFPGAERLARQIINLPFHPYLSERDQAQVTAAARAVLGS